MKLMKRFLGFSFWLFVCAVCAAEEVSTMLEVTSQPAGAVVWIDHVNRGITPLTLAGVAEGTHLIQVEKEGFDGAFATAELKAGTTCVVPLVLQTQNGILLLRTDPAGCEVTENGVSLGTTPLLVTTLSCGKHKLSLNSPGYRAKEITVTLEGRTPVKQEVSLQSDSGTLDVTSEPSGAEVFVNGISRGVTPCRVARVSGGVVSFVVKATGFRPYTSEISLTAGEVQTLHAALKPLPGTLHVVSIPDGGRVYVDDEFKGLTPCTLVNVVPGMHRVRVDAKGCEAAGRDVSLTNGASLTEEFRLVKITGRIEIFTAPSGATVLLNGKKKGITLTHKTDLSALSDAFSLENIVEGEYELEVVKKGYGTQHRKVKVSRDKTLSLQIPLKRLFIPNYEVTTTRSQYRGVLEFLTEEGIRIETSPGISQTIPMKDVKKHGYLKEAE